MAEKTRSLFAGIYMQLYLTPCTYFLPASSGTRPAMIAATPTAPPPSTTYFSCSTNRSIARASQSSFTVICKSYMTIIHPHYVHVSSPKKHIYAISHRFTIDYHDAYFMMMFSFTISFFNLNSNQRKASVVSAVWESNREPSYRRQVFSRIA